MHELGDGKGLPLPAKLSKWGAMKNDFQNGELKSTAYLRGAAGAVGVSS
jgi:hypothetical protein